MNKSTGLFLLGLVVTWAGNAQKSHYFELNTGYQLGIAEKNVLSLSTGYEGNDYPFGEINASLGQGLTVGASFVLQFNKTIGLDLSGTFLQGSQFTSHHVIEHPEMISTFHMNARMGCFTPSLRLTKDFGSLAIYAKVGPSIGIGRIDRQFNFRQAQYSHEVFDKYYGGFALGVGSMVGAKYQLSSKLSLFGGVTFNWLNYAPRKTETIVLEINREDVLDEMTPYERYGVYYTDKTPVEDRNHSDETMPRSLPSVTYPFSNVGFKVGVSFWLKPKEMKLEERS
jgi:hypothetical protein